MSDGRGVGVIVGIVIGILAALGIVAAAVWYYIRRKKDKELLARETAEKK